jgi:hypothetical protein
MGCGGYAEETLMHLAWANCGVQRMSLRATADAESFAVRIVVFLGLLLGLQGGASAQMIAIEDQSLAVNGKTIVLPAPKSAVIDALGASYDTYPPVGDGFSDWVYRWTQFGVEAYSNQVSHQVGALRLLVARPGYWKGALFSGELWIEGKLLCPDEPIGELEKAGFKDDHGNLSIRRGCFYVTLNLVNDGAVEAIEIGNRVELPLVRLPSWRNLLDPCTVSE